jgi:hypothetical protein
MFQTTNNNDLEHPNIFVLEQDAITKLTIANKMYQRYFCSLNNTTYTTLCAEFNDKYADISQFNDAVSAANDSIIALKTAIAALPTYGTGTSYVNKNDYATNYDTIMSNYKDIVKKRQELDSSLTELYEIGDTAGNFYQKKLISTSYTKILLTIIATSLTVAAFMTMRNKS